MPVIARSLVAMCGFAYSAWVALQFLGAGLVGFPKGELFVVQLLRWMFLAAVIGMPLGFATVRSPRSAKSFLLIAVAPLICISGAFVLGAAEKGDPLSLIGAVHPLLVAGAFAGGWYIARRLRTDTTSSKVPPTIAEC